MSVRTTVYDPAAAAAADQAAAAAALDDVGAAAAEDEGKGVVPSKDDLEMLILQLKSQNPDWGYKRMLTAIRCVVALPVDCIVFAGWELGWLLGVVLGMLCEAALCLDAVEAAR